MAKKSKARQIAVARRGKKGAEVPCKCLYGLWTPTIDYTDITGEAYSSQHGYFTRTGRLVTASFDLTLRNKGTGTNSPVVIKGLPFAATGGVGFGSIRWAGMSTPVVWMGVSTNAGTRALLLYQITGPAAGYSITRSADVSDVTGFVGTVSYFV
jgi:hypothetical protein